MHATAAKLPRALRVLMLQEAPGCMQKVALTQTLSVWVPWAQQARKFYVEDLLRQTNATSADGCFIDTGDAIAIK